MSRYLLAIDQGTTSTRVIIFAKDSHLMSQHQIELQQFYPQPGWVEHDPEEIWQATLNCCRFALAKAKLLITDIAAIGISNQRETTVIWDKTTGKAIHHAIVWQDRRTADFCKQLSTTNVVKTITQKTGLVLDPYFSASKIHWLLENVPQARKRAEVGELLFGTIDTYLLWRLTNGKSHATDVTNAARTLLFNIETLTWDEELLKFFAIPKQILPQVFDCCHHFGNTAKELLGAEIPITGIAGDQQAALIGHACFQANQIKITYGTGSFLLLNTGPTPVYSQHNLLTTIAYRINGEIAYGLEGSIFNAGTAVQWLRDSLKLIKDANETEMLAKKLNDNGGVYFVPSFTGLGAPYWQPNARGAILGLTRATDLNHIIRAALEAVCYQTYDLLQIMMQDANLTIEKLRVDGGMVKNNWLMQFLSDLLGIIVQKPVIIETSALGAAYLAGLTVGLYSSLTEISTLWRLDAEFKPGMAQELREHNYLGWKKAINSLLSNL